MNTLGYLFVLVGLVVIRQITKGRGLTDIPGDLGDMVTSVITNDMDNLSAVLHRTGTASDADGAVPSANTSNETTYAGKGDALLAEAKRIGNGKPYVWGATGPNGYDCSGLVWRAMKNLSIYTGVRFTSGTFAAVAKAKGLATRVSTPARGDIVVWSGHMGIVEDGTNFYSALSKRSGIKSLPMTAIHRGTPTFYRLTANASYSTIPTGKFAGKTVPS